MANIKGTSGNDNLIGTPSNDVLNAYRGNDTLNGGAGVDTLIGGRGSDTYIVNSTTDTIVEYSGGGAHDLVKSSASYTLGNYINDLTLTGTSDINGIGNSLDNIIIGNAANNYLPGGGGNDFLSGGAGNDTLDAFESAGNNTLRGGDGDDFLTAQYSTGNNTLSGGAGDDSLNALASTGNNTLRGGDGDDSLRAGLGKDIVDGGTGKDSLGVDYYAATSGISINLAASTSNGTITVGSSSVTFSGIELFSISGTAAYNDTLVGSNGNDTLDGGGGGNDFLSGGAGNDQLLISYGSTGNNSLEGGDGDDFLTAQYSIGNNTLSGGDGNDILYADQSTGSNTLLGGDGNDIISAGVGKAIVDGGTGTDTLQLDYHAATRGISINLTASVPNGTITVGSSSVIFSSVEQFGIYGTQYDDSLVSGNGNDTLEGNGGSDFLSGSAGDDFLSAFGSTGNNTLRGDEGNDTLSGGRGNDTLTGGSGNDSYAYDAGTVFDSLYVGLDTITDFHQVAGHTDKIVLSKETFTAITSNIGTGFSKSIEFAVVANDTAAAASQAFIVYSQGTGDLFYNQNGALAGFGTGAEFATLTTYPLLAASDFIIQET